MSSSTLNGASEVFTSNVPVNGGNPGANSQESTSPEQIGWYFVESYYTNLNKSPDRLHLFYQKKSSFIWGTEGDNVPVSQGRAEISERIKQLEFKDCKVRVTNVDSQGSGTHGIIVQVLGDMTNNSEPSRRFCQTFFLAEQHQPAGYYVLNDIFRFLKEDEEEEEVALETGVEEDVDTAPEPVAEAVPVAAEKETVEVPAEEPEAEIPAATTEKEDVEEAPAPAAEEPVEAAPEPEEEKAEEPVVAPAVPIIPVVQAAAPEPVQTEAAPEPVTEAPKAPSPAPPPVSQEPVKPKSWAALVSGNKPAPPAAPAAAPAQAPATQTPAATATPATPSTPSAQSNSGWQTTESRRQNRPVSISGPPEGQTLAYVKGVTERVGQQALKDALSKFGALKSFEVDVAKVCAFVEFAEPSAFIAAAAANPHRINGQNVFVEERRFRQGNTRFSGPSRGGSAPRGGERSGSRGGSQRGPGGDRFDGPRNMSGGGRGGPGGGRGGGFQRGGRGGAPNTAGSSN